MEDNRFAGVGAIVIRENRVLLVRHTYGSAKGKLLNPGGMIQHGEMPNEAIQREVFEETCVVIKPVGMLCIRCSAKDWYMVFAADYVSGEPKSDDHENSEALFMDCDELLTRDDATQTVKTLVRLALSKKPIHPLNDEQGRLLFAANEDL